MNSEVNICYRHTRGHVTMACCIESKAILFCEYYTCSILECIEALKRLLYKPVLVYGNLNENVKE